MLPAIRSARLSHRFPVIVPSRRLHSQSSSETSSHQSSSPCKAELPRSGDQKHEPHDNTATSGVGFNPPGALGLGGRNTANSSLFDTALATLAGLGIVFIGGVAYLQWYKWNVLNKVEKAFAPGYDPALELATHHTKRFRGSSGEESWILKPRRREQDTVDHIVHGHETGHYYMLLGPKGSGKGTMILDAMAACQADGVAMCDAHPDLEVFRLKLGKALNYEFFEDSQTGLFQRRDPREGGPRLDIERALNKLEKVALRCVQKRNKPLVLVVNNVHYFKNNEEGRNMLLQLQQRAEAWAASGIVTMIFSSDEIWPFHVMRRNSSRMTVMSISDLNEKEALQVVSQLRSRLQREPAGEKELKEVVSLVGGRLSYLDQVSKAKDMVCKAKHLLAIEKGWLLSQIGLIPDCDDDVMDEQKWSSCSWLLLREFAKLRQEQIKEREVINAGTFDPATDLPLPVIPYWKCRRIMTRADFMEELDHLNIISIDFDLNVRPNSLLILHAACEVVEEEGFDELLDSVRGRVDEIESLHRTRELAFKDLSDGDTIRLSVDKGNTKLDKVYERNTSI